MNCYQCASNKIHETLSRFDYFVRDPVAKWRKLVPIESDAIVYSQPSQCNFMLLWEAIPSCVNTIFRSERVRNGLKRYASSISAMRPVVWVCYNNLYGLESSLQEL